VFSHYAFTSVSARRLRLLLRELTPVWQAS